MAMRQNCGLIRRLLLLLSCSFLPCCVVSFLPATAPAIRLRWILPLQRRQPDTTAILVLFAKKAGKQASKNNKSKSSKQNTGAGFGTGSNQKNDGSSSTPLASKLRSVSSRQTGAGSKPLRQAALAFDRIRKDYSTSNHCRDVYVRSPLNSETTFWFVGKIAFEDADDDNDANNEDAAVIAVDGAVAACLSQKRLIFEYSMQQLRPQNLGGKYASALELWLAPADSEMDVVQNKVSLVRITGSAADLPDDFTVDRVGYNPEIYVGDEIEKGGLRVERDSQGHPTKPVFEVNESA